MGWRAETKEVIRRYPQHCRAEMQLRAVSVTAAPDGSRVGHSVARTTENAALRELPPRVQRELDAVRMAISTTMRYRNGADRIRMIDKLYWSGREIHLYRIPMEMHISYDTAKNWHNAFIELTDAYLRVL